MTSRLLNRDNRLTNSRIFEALSIEAGDRFVEIGFGGAELLFNVAATNRCKSLYGIEKSESMLERAQNKIDRSARFQNINLMLGDVAELPLEDGKFNKICSNNTLYFWDSLERGAQEISRITASGGKVVLGFTTGEKMKNSGYEERGFRFYEVDQVNNAMEDAALRLQDTHKLRAESEGAFYVSVYQKKG